MSVTTEGQQVLSTRGEHNHHPDLGKTDSRKVIHDVQTLSSDCTPTVAIAAALVPVSDSYATLLALPNKNSLVTQILPLH